MIIRLMDIFISLCFVFILIMLGAIPVIIYFDTDILFWIGLVGELTCWIALPVLMVIDYFVTWHRRKE